MSELTDDQLLRYSRHLMLPEIGIEGQQKLSDSRVLIAGLGGLGSPAAMYLASSGVGHLILADGDSVDQSNLQRQIIHSESSIGMPKTESAKRCLQALAPGAEIQTCGHLSAANLSAYVSRVDIVLDCSDNFETRYALNECCAEFKKPLVSGAAIRMEGQVCTFTYSVGTACYECLYPRDSKVDESCVENGVIAPVVGIIGCIQAMEAIKLLINFGTLLSGRLLLLDAARMEWREVQLPKNPICAVCSEPAAAEACV